MFSPGTNAPKPTLRVASARSWCTMPRRVAMAHACAAASASADPEPIRRGVVTLWRRRTRLVRRTASAFQHSVSVREAQGVRPPAPPSQKARPVLVLARLSPALVLATAAVPAGAAAAAATEGGAACAVASSREAATAAVAPDRSVQTAMATGASRRGQAPGRRVDLTSEGGGEAGKWRWDGDGGHCRASCPGAHGLGCRQ